jgi:hypothetical protein
MRVNFFDFGRDHKVHHALGVLTPEDMNDGPEDGYGLLVCELKYPAEGHEFGEDITLDKVEPLFGIWYHCEESLDVAIDKLMRIKKLFQEEHVPMEEDYTDE